MTTLITLGLVGYVGFKVTKFAMKAASPAGTAVETGFSLWQWMQNKRQAK